MMKQLQILLLSIFILNMTSHALAKDVPEMPDDFAYGTTIDNFSSSTPFYQFKLPSQVYLNTAYSDLRDIRIFNDRGHVLPYALKRAQYQQEKEAVVDLTVVPLTPSQIKQNKEGYHIDIQAGDGALNTSIQLDHMDWDKNTSNLYLIKLPQTDSEQTRDLDRLQLKWTRLNQTWQAKLSVSTEGVDEYFLKKQAKVSELVTANEHLLLNRVELSDVTIGKESHFLILNLTLENGVALPELTAVEGVSVSQKTQEDKVSFDFPLETSSETEAIYSFTKEQAIDSLHITPQQNNSIYPVSIEYKSNTSKDWLPLMSDMSIYRFDDNNHTPAIKVHQKNIKQLRIKALNGNWGDKAPEIVMKRDEVYVFFNAQGHQNLLLAWGSAKAANKALSIDELIPQNLRPKNTETLFDADNIQLARVDSDNIITLGGEIKLTDLNAQRVLWQKYLLWGLLLFGVVMLGFLVFKLWRDIQKAHKDHV